LCKDLTIAIHRLSETIGIVADMADGIRSGSEEITRQPTTCRAGSNKGNLKERLLPQSNYGTSERADGGVCRRVVSITHSTAQHMSEIVGSAIVAMDRIDRSSEEIGGIIGMIGANHLDSMIEAKIHIIAVCWRHRRVSISVRIRKTK
jgi:hypothetical protein